MKTAQQRDKHTGRFVPNKNEFVTKGGNIYCYLNGELLFFTDEQNASVMVGRIFSKFANGYSATRINGKEVPVHRFLTNAPVGSTVDHINRNKADNRISNLRITNKSENGFNCGLRSNNSSGVTGVWYRKDTKKWSAEIMKNQKKICLGSFANKEDAIKARQDAEERLYGYKL